MDIQSINTVEDYNKVIAEIERLWDIEQSSINERELERLAKLIHEYERANEPLDEVFEFEDPLPGTYLLGPKGPEGTHCAGGDGPRGPVVNHPIYWDMPAGAELNKKLADRFPMGGTFFHPDSHKAFTVAGYPYDFRDKHYIPVETGLNGKPVYFVIEWHD